MEVFLIPSQMYSKALEPAPSVGLALLPWELCPQLQSSFQAAK